MHYEQHSLPYSTDPVPTLFPGIVNRVEVIGRHEIKSKPHKTTTDNGRGEGGYWKIVPAVNEP